MSGDMVSTRNNYGQTIFTKLTRFQTFAQYQHTLAHNQPSIFLFFLKKTLPFRFYSQPPKSKRKKYIPKNPKILMLFPQYPHQIWLPRNFKQSPSLPISLYNSPLKKNTIVIATKKKDAYTCKRRVTTGNKQDCRNRVDIKSEC
jgi:hypothetical protein